MKAAMKESGLKEGACGFLKKDLICGDKARKIWIVRVTNEVADALDSASGGEELGRLTMEGKGKDCVRQVSFYARSSSVSSASADASAPTEFDLQPSNQTGTADDGKAYAFSVARDVKSVQLEGSVTQHYSLRPHVGNRFDEYARKRTLNAHEHAFGKKIKAMNTDESVKAALASSRPSAVFVPSTMYRSADDSRSGKAAADAARGGEGGASAGGSAAAAGRTGRTAETEASGAGGVEGMRAALFDMFAAHEKVWIKDIEARLGISSESSSSATSGGKQQLRQLLREFCDKEKVGNKAYYMLNRDYR